MGARRREAISVVVGIPAIGLLLFAAGSGASEVPFRTVVIDAAMAGDCKMAGDIDGDGRVDLVVGGMPSEGMVLYRWPNWAKTTIATPNAEFTTDAALADLDGDRDLDIVVPDGSGSQNLVWLANPLPHGSPSGAPWVRRAIGTIGGWGKDVKPADYDGDGRMDVATRSSSEVLVFFQEATSSWSRMAFSGLPTGSEGLGSGDIDLDGDTDLVIQGAWLRNPGGVVARTPSLWTTHAIGSAPSEFKSLVVDLDRDGRPDVLFSSSEATADVRWWSPPAAGPTGSWTGRTIVAAVERAHTLQAADVDLDGDTDVFVAQMHTAAATEVYWMENLDGLGTSWAKRLLGTGGLHNGVVADVGGDGDWDLFGANWTGNPPVRIFENLWTPAPVGPLGFSPVAPCRLIDTRWAPSSRGGPALAAGGGRSFAHGGSCGLPASARALAVNLTVTQPSTPGHLVVHPSGTAAPTASTLNYAAGQTRANNAVLRLGSDGGFDVRCVQSTGTVHLIVDVIGWFE